MTFYATRLKSEPVDLRDLEYVDAYDHNLMCPICRAPFVNPVQLECGHVFCHRCLNDAVVFQGGVGNPGHRATCSSCRRKVNYEALTSVPKILCNILDELRVRCPLNEQGCDAILARGEVQSHADKYCACLEMVCPEDDCSKMLLRRDWEQGRCLHNMVRCEDCLEDFMEKDIAHHRRNDCAVGKAVCPDCKTQLLHRDLEEHIGQCPKAIFSCGANDYGCDFISQRTSLDEHQKTCPLLKLVPFLKMQNDRLEAHEDALKHLRLKNTILETSFSTLQETLSPSANIIDAPAAATASDTGPFDSTAHHLLCLHESLREEVSRVSAAVSEVDARASMMVMNEGLRIKEDLSHTNAAIGSLRVQLHWLMSARLQNQQRVAMVRAQGSGDGLGPGTSTTAGGPSENLALPIRKLSDTARQDPKL